jgi:signal transduction histidine kinase
MIDERASGMSTDAERTPWFDVVYEYMPPVLGALPYALLAAATGLDLISRGGFTSAGVIDIAIAGVLAVWMLALLSTHPGWIERPVLMGVFFVGLLAGGTALVIRAPVFGFYTFTGYLWAFRALRGRFRLAGLAAVATMSTLSQVGGPPHLSASDLLEFVVILLINLGVATAIAWVTAADHERRRQRDELITELTQANGKLERSLSENAELQSRLVDQAREAGVLDERQRMAHEIHDTLAQALTGIITQLQAADQATLEEGERRRHLNAAASLARSGLSEARRSFNALRPEPLESARLPEALDEVARHWTALNGVPVELRTTGSPQRMRVEIEIALLRTAQEALTNVAKYAHAKRVGLTLSYMEDQVTLDVRDDGAGFDPSVVLAPSGATERRAGTSVGAGGFGLAAMRQRVQALAGSLEVESEPGGGTAISASLPAITAPGAL